MQSPTLFLLMAEHQGKTVLPVDEVAEKYWNMSAAQARRLANEGRFPLPCFRMNNSRKAPWVVLLTDLAQHIDQRRQEAIDEAHAMKALFG